MSKLYDEAVDIIGIEIERRTELSEYEEAEAFQLCMDYGIPCEYGICDECIINNSIIKEVE